MACILDLFISYNLSYRREEPLVFVADEIPTIRLERLFNWIAEERSNGFVPIIGYQFNPQIENEYGRERTRTLIGACATKFLFSPQELGTAEEFTKYFDDEDVFLKTLSRTSGQHPSLNASEQHHKRPLFSIRDILALPRGTCIFVNPTYQGKGYKGDEEAGVPWRLKVKIPRIDWEAQKRAQNVWDKKMHGRLVARAKREQIALDDEILARELKNRIDAADLLLPPLLTSANTPVQTQNASSIN